MLHAFVDGDSDSDSDDEASKAGKSVVAPTRDSASSTTLATASEESDSSVGKKGPTMKSISKYVHLFSYSVPISFPFRS